MRLSCINLLSAVLLLSVCSTVGRSSEPPAGLKNLLKVPDNVRVPDCFFVHVSHRVTENEIHLLVDELRTLDADASATNFSAKVKFVITKLGYGFAAELSAEALHYVS